MNIKMQQVYSISLAIVREATDSSDTKCAVVLDGKHTNIIVSGHVLEAAVQIDETRYVLFITHDCPLEETLTIALIDIHDGLKEVLWLGIMYGTGFFEDLSIIKDSIQFRFFDECIYILKIFRSPIWRRWPFLSEEVGVIHRKTSLKKYMSITFIPAPPAVLPDGSLRFSHD